MAVSREQLVFDVLASTSKAESGFTAVGRKAAAAADDVSGLAKRLDEISRKSATARVGLQGDREAQAKLDKLDFKTEQLAHRVIDVPVTIEGAARAAMEIGTLDAELDKLSSKSEDAGKAATGLKGRFAALAGTGAGTGLGGSGMAALVGAGAALSGQITTVGFGLGGLAGAAYGVIKPIETAAKKAGGLQQNLHTLDPQQQAVAKSLLDLEHQYDSFQNSLKPEILGAFNEGFRIAGHLMHDVQPIAAATGKALDQVLGSVDKEFQSGTWQQFFTWMAQQAAPDMQQLGKTFTDLLQALPPLIQDLNPLGKGLLIVADDAAKATGGIARFYQSFQRNVPVSNQNVGNFLKDLDHWTVELTNHLGPWARAINNAGTQAQQSLGDTGAAADRTTTSFTHVIHASGGLVSPMNGLGKVVPAVARALDAVDRNGRPVVTNFDQQITKLKGLVTGYQNALTAESNYINAQITEAGDLHSLNQALQLSHDRIGLKTQAERNSYAATQTFIQQTTQTGDAAVKTGKGIQGQIDIIGKALPALERVKGKTAEYRQELRNLKDILDKLRQEKLISEVVHVSGQGTWRFGAAPGGSVAGPGGRFQGPGPSAAAGWMVSGGIPGRDSVLVNAMPGELIVPTRMVAAGLVDHLRGAIPGFAGGGIVPSYSGSPGGLSSWTSNNQQATILAIGRSIGNAMASSFMAAAASPGFGIAPSGPLQSYARALLAAYGWSNQWPQFNAVVMRESGWRVNASNPSGAYGIPQALPGSKMASAGADWMTDGFTQLRWMMGYIKSTYGDPAGAWNSELTRGWYDNGGYLPTGLSLALNTTGHPERVGGGNTYVINVNVPPSANKADVGRQVVEVIREYERRSGPGWRK